jgi:hypothetical protein
VSTPRVTADESISRCPRHKHLVQIPDCSNCSIGYLGYEHALQTFDSSKNVPLDSWIKLCMTNAFHEAIQDEYAGVSPRYQVEGRRLRVPYTQPWRRERYSENEDLTETDEYKVQARRAAMLDPDDEVDVVYGGDNSHRVRSSYRHFVDASKGSRDPTAATALEQVRQQLLREEAYPLINAVVETYPPNSWRRQVLKLLLEDELVEDLGRKYGFSHQKVRALLHELAENTLLLLAQDRVGAY